MREDKISKKEATKLYKDAIVEVIFNRPRKYARRRFIEITPRHFQEIPKGKAFKLTNAEGPIRSLGYVSRVIKLKRYWEFINLMADEYGISIKEARTRKKAGAAGFTLEEIYNFYFAPRKKNA